MKAASLAGTLLSTSQSPERAGEVIVEIQKVIGLIYSNSLSGLSLRYCLDLYLVGFNFQIWWKDGTMTAGFKERLT